MKLLNEAYHVIGQSAQAFEVKSASDEVIYRRLPDNL